MNSPGGWAYACRSWSWCTSILRSPPTNRPGGPGPAARQRGPNLGMDYLPGAADFTPDAQDALGPTRWRPPGSSGRRAHRQRGPHGAQHQPHDLAHLRPPAAPAVAPSTTAPRSSSTTGGDGGGRGDQAVRPPPPRPRPRHSRPVRGRRRLAPGHARLGCSTMSSPRSPTPGWPTSRASPPRRAAPGHVTHLTARARRSAVWLPTARGWFAGRRRALTSPPCTQRRRDRGQMGVHRAQGEQAAARARQLARPPGAGGRGRVPSRPGRRRRGAAAASRHHRASYSRSRGGSGRARSAAGLGVGALGEQYERLGPGPVRAPVRARVDVPARLAAERSPPQPQAQQRERQQAALQAGHAGAVQPRGGGPVGGLRLGPVLSGRGEPQRPVPLGEDAHQRQFVALGQPVRGGRVPVGGREVGERGAGLEADEVAEHLVGHQAVPGGQGDQLGADLVPARGQPGAVEGLHEHAVEGERQQRGIVQPAGDLLGLAARPRARAASGCRATPARSWPAARRAAPPRARRAARAARPGCVRPPRRSRAACSGSSRAGPDRRDVVRADHAGGQFRRRRTPRPRRWPPARCRGPPPGRRRRSPRGCAAGPPSTPAGRGRRTATVRS